MSRLESSVDRLVLRGAGAGVGVGFGTGVTVGSVGGAGEGSRGGVIGESGGLGMSA